MKKVKTQVKLRNDTLGFTEDYLHLLNGILKLTSTELKVLAKFISIDNKVFAPKNSRKIVAAALKMKNVAVLNNYIKALKDKGCISKNKLGLYVYNPIVAPSIELESIEFILKAND